MENDRQVAALRRLLADAAHGGQAKVDALLALAQRTVFVVPWPRPEDGLRTLVSSNGESALPIFTDVRELEAAVERFGWKGPEGGMPSREVGSREAFRYARDRGLSFVVVDITSDHSMEISKEEIEPLLSPAARRDSSGPFAGAGKISSSLMRAVRPTPHNLPAAEINAPRLDPAQIAARLSIPQALPAPPPGSSPGTQPSVHEAKTTPGGAAAPTGSSPGRVAASGKSSPGSVEAPSGPPVTLHPSIRLGAPVGTIEDSLLDRLDAVLREFPEVEFACVGSAGGVNAFGLRIDARVRKRLDALGGALGRVSPPGAHFYLLDDPDHFRAARAEALVFFPWRRR